MLSAPVSSALHTTVDDLDRAFAIVDLDDVADYFKTTSAPFVVATGVSVDVFNAYVDLHDETMVIRLRFLELQDNGDVVITDLPSKAHEKVVQNFAELFRDAAAVATGSRRHLESKGTFTANNGTGSKKEGDATFGPRGSTPDWTACPPEREMDDWVTVAIEVGYSQSWTSLEVAAKWWAAYDGVRYIVLLKFDEANNTMTYRVYHIYINGPLPAPAFEGQATAPGMAIITFQTSIVLSVARTDVARHGWAPEFHVDLWDVLTSTLADLRPVVSRRGPVWDFTGLF